MGIAFMSSLRSKDPVTCCGACIVDSNQRILGIGYNGMPRGLADDIMPWGKAEGLDNKHFYVCHAEMNAIMNSSKNLEGCTLYSTLFPCNECCKLIIQAGIREVIYASDEKADKLSYQASKRMFDLAKIRYTAFKGDSLAAIKIEFPAQVERITKIGSTSGVNHKFMAAFIGLVAFGLGVFGTLAGQTLAVLV